MSTSNERAATRAAVALFRVMLLAYPPRFRRRHGNEMVRVFRDRARRRLLVHGRAGLLRHLAGAVADVAVTAPAEWLHPIGAREGPGARRGSRLARFGREVRWAGRSLRRSPAFTGVAVVTVALGIGATTAIFTLVDGILLRSLPYPDPDRLVVVKHAVPALDLPEAGLSEGTYLHYREHARSLERIGAYLENVVNLAGDGTPERVQVALVSSGLLEMLGARPAVGRLFTEEEQAPFDPEVMVSVVLSHDLWVRQYGGDPAVVGRTVELNAAPKRVVGVLEAGFGFPGPATAVWYPLGLDPSSAAVDGFYFGSVARLAPGVAPADAERELRALVPGLAEAHPDAAPALFGEGGLTPLVRTLEDEVVGEARPVLWILMGSVTLVLLVACANVVNLMLVRAEHRRREVALRLALGAGRGRLLRQLLVESLVLGLAGGALGVGLAFAFSDAAAALLPFRFPGGFTPDGCVLAGAAALSVLTAVAAGLLPAAHVARREPEPSGS
ncbi:MAG: ABC transporter permease, partial [Gemmatimonadetes bacterium]|nr:ABC transporter permease [Gemmatimonadota bacterium]